MRLFPALLCFTLFVAASIPPSEAATCDDGNAARSASKRKPSTEPLDERGSKRLKLLHMNVLVERLITAIEEHDFAFLNANLEYSNIYDGFSGDHLLSCALSNYNPLIISLLIRDSRVNIRAFNDRCLTTAMRLKRYPELMLLASRYYREGHPNLAKEALIVIVQEARNIALAEPNYRIKFLQVFSDHGVVPHITFFDSLLVHFWHALKGTRNTFRDTLSRIGLLHHFPAPSRPELLYRYIWLRYGNNVDAQTAFIQSHYTPEQMCNQLLYFLPSRVLNSLQTSGFVKTEDIRPEADLYLSFLDAESAKVYPPDFAMHYEERFWLMALFDNHKDILRLDKVYTMGATMGTNSDPVVMTDLFHRHTCTVLDSIDPLSLLPGDEEALKQLWGYLRDLLSSDERFQHSVRMEQVTKTISDLHPGESFALGIHCKMTVGSGKGHVAVGIITAQPHREGQEEKIYDMMIVNSGTQAPRTPHLPFRILTSVEQVGMPLSVILEKYLKSIVGYENLYDPRYFKTDLKTMLEGTSLSQTGRGQRSGTCSVERLWALAKMLLGPALYMEFKVRFIISFLEQITASFDGLVLTSWKSRRASVWAMAIYTPLLERSLLRQLRRIEDSDPVRALLLRDLILDSFKRRYSPRMGEKCLDLL